MKRLRQDWDEFLFAQRPAATLGAFRIAYGLVVLSWCILIGPDLKSWYGQGGLFPLSAMRAWGAGDLGLDLLAMHTWTGLMFHHAILADVTDFRITIGAFVVLVLAAVCLTVGYKTRAASIVVWALLASFHHRDMVILNGGDTLQRNLAFLMMFTDAGAALSIDRLVRVARGRETADSVPMTEMWPVRLIQIQVSLVYLSAVASKIMGVDWRDGTAFWYAMQLTDLRRFSLFGLEYRPLFYSLFSYGTIATEFSLAVLIWVPRLRRYAITAGILLHAGIEWAMTVPLFSFTMVTSYIVFIDSSSVSVAAQWLRERLHPGRIVLPQSLPWPPRLVETIRALDGLRLISFGAASAESVDAATVGRVLWRLPAIWAFLVIPPALVLVILPTRYLLVPIDIVWPIVAVASIYALSGRIAGRVSMWSRLPRQADAEPTPAPTA